MVSRRLVWLLFAAALFLSRSFPETHAIREISNFCISSERQEQTKKNLIVINALGRNETLKYNVFAKRHHFKNWDCIAFMYVTESVIPDNNQELMSLKTQGCSIIRAPRLFWGVFLQFLPPPLVSKYEHIAILLDDVHLPIAGPFHVLVEKLIQKMKIYNLTSISPAVSGASHNEILPGGNYSLFKCIAAVKYIETYFQIFTIEGWNCFYAMLHHSGGRGWCYDTCYRRFCPSVKLAIDFSQVAYHLEISTPPKYALPDSFLTGTGSIERKGDMYSMNQPATSLCKKHRCSVKRSRGRSPLYCNAMQETDFRL